MILLRNRCSLGHHGFDKAAGRGDLDDGATVSMRALLGVLLAEEGQPGICHLSKVSQINAAECDQRFLANIGRSRVFLLGVWNENIDPSDLCDCYRIFH